MCALLSLKYTFASLTDSDNVHNDFKIGGHRAEIEEIFSEPTLDKPANLNVSYIKKPKITNQDDTKMFVRVMILPKVISKDGILLSSEIGKDIQLDIPNEWTDGKDGYYYYNTVLEPKKSTKDIFSTVTFKNSNYVDAKVTIELKLETIVAISNSYKEAFWNGDPYTDTLKKIDQKYAEAL